MSLPFIDPFSCRHEVERIVSEKKRPAGSFNERITIFRCAVCTALVEDTRYEPHQPGEYLGPNFLFRDYWVREVRRSGSQRRSVYLQIVGVGRVMRVGRKAFERERRGA